MCCSNLKPQVNYVEPKPWMDKLQVLQKLASTKRSARIFKAIADPPTTSLQRLKVISALSLLSYWVR